MDSFEKTKLKLYGLFWGAVLVVPTLPLLWGTSGITGHFSSFEEIFSLWLSILPVFVLFWVHNFLVFPLHKKHKPLYIVAGLVLLAIFGIYCFTLGNHPPGVPQPMHPTELPPPSHRPARPGALILGFGVLALLMNIGADAMVENSRKEKERSLLEIENIRLQLDTLRYQINPHFFLNTLNNIQALVLIDPDRATESIAMFSKLMQLVLRSGNAPVIPLSDELSCLKCYIALMQLRYPDEVQIETNFPSRTGDAVIQPLILGTFVENAFKHGISYGRPSLVRVQLELKEEKIFFRCENTLFPDSLAKDGGIGLENSRKRLTLLYGDSYELNAAPSSDRFVLELTLPDKIEMLQG